MTTEDKKVDIGPIHIADTGVPTKSATEIDTVALDEAIRLIEDTKKMIEEIERKEKKWHFFLMVLTQKN